MCTCTRCNINLFSWNWKVQHFLFREQNNKKYFTNDKTKSLRLLAHRNQSCLKVFRQEISLHKIYKKKHSAIVYFVKVWFEWWMTTIAKHLIKADKIEEVPAVNEILKNIRYTNLCFADRAILCVSQNKDNKKKVEFFFDCCCFCVSSLSIVLCVLVLSFFELIVKHFIILFDWSSFKIAIALK